MAIELNIIDATGSGCSSGSCETDVAPAPLAPTTAKGRLAAQQLAAINPEGPIDWRFRRMLSLTPAYPGRWFGGVRPPVGISYVEEFVASRGVDTAGIDMNTTRRKKELFRKIEEFKPDVVGVTMMTYQYMSTYDLIDELKARYPHLKFVLGGPHVSALEAGVLDQCQSVDYAIAGEGEIPMLQLCQGAPPESIAGLHYRDGESVKSGPPRELVQDLDQFPYPRFKSYDLSKYTNEVEISTSRGCPHKCIFCSVPNIMGKQIRYRSAKSVGDEMEHFYKLGIRSFQFGDDNFLANRHRIKELMHEIESRNFEGAVLRCGQGIRADLINEQVLVAMKRAGFKQLGIGVESGSDRIMAIICKHLTVEQVDKAVGLACEQGFDVTLLFVYGTPGETLEDVQKSIDLAKKHPVMKAFFFNLVPFPGTALSDWVNENAALLGPFEHMFNREDEWKLRSQPFFETPEMPTADRHKALKMTVRASQDIQVATLKRKLKRFGVLGDVAAQAARFNTLERLFVRNRTFRRLLDRVMFN
ncbi:Ribosomal protein S12 methylthiotransferase RimO [Pseudobythopirellula maris]|uniref:Ribosomal protein S12 methylthiotransferase RimO n=1 Tax=Pseudobythopirellula maris TaxID=2527991 RepID=A0A5C5ZSR8_9BACT|nr:radical SAM protein [Pseudobythopirellula maris]TWT89821.1 Ribosomal protein S12 methylthiotransferase RimO [Pseudobythopirellula maris]